MGNCMRRDGLAGVAWHRVTCGAGGTNFFFKKAGQARRAWMSGRVLAPNVRAVVAFFIGLGPRPIPDPWSGQQCCEL